MLTTDLRRVLSAAKAKAAASGPVGSQYWSFLDLLRKPSIIFLVPLEVNPHQEGEAYSSLKIRVAQKTAWMEDGEEP